jgi:hypothetical protein
MIATCFLVISYTAYPSAMGGGSAVGIATGYWLDDRGVVFRVPVGSKVLTSPYRPCRIWVPHGLVTEALSAEVKWRRSEADHSPTTGAEVKKKWIYTSTPPYAYMA